MRKRTVRARGMGGDSEGNGGVWSEGVPIELAPEIDDEVEGKEDDDEVRWVNHYSSAQQILVVGDGDFSFSLCLAVSFSDASNITATSLDSREKLVTMYAKSKSNLESLKNMGATLLHEIDATKMKQVADLKMRKFDRIIFNFPHAGFKGKEDHLRLINLHRKLVNGFFRNASHMLRPFGEVHVSHKITSPFYEWNLEELASKNSLTLIKCVKFDIKDYPGYNNKRGDGSRCDLPFPLGECATYMFVIGDVHKKEKRFIKGPICENSGAKSIVGMVPLHAPTYPPGLFPSRIGSPQQFYRCHVPEPRSAPYSSIMGPHMLRSSTYPSIMETNMPSNVLRRAYFTTVNNPHLDLSSFANGHLRPRRETDHYGINSFQGELFFPSLSIFERHALHLRSFNILNEMRVRGMPFEHTHEREYHPIRGLLGWLRH